MNPADEWRAAVNAITPEVHPIDRDAIRIWFAHWPLLAIDVLASRPDRGKMVAFFQMNGQFDLTPLADTSHIFLYGHRYWMPVKAALDTKLEGDPLTRIRTTAERSGAPLEFALAMSAIAWMTVEQCGPAFLPLKYEPKVPMEEPETFLRRRATSFRPSLVERFKGRAPTERIIFQENDEETWFPIIPTQEITTAAELDKRPFHTKDKRCYEGMGPIPVDCRAGSCGTCWIGILGGNENLDPIEGFERTRMEYFGYWDSGFVDTSCERPLIRLACQTRANSSVSIVIPAWNGVFGKTRREKELVD